MKNSESLPPALRKTVPSQSQSGSYHNFQNGNYLVGLDSRQPSPPGSRLEYTVTPTCPAMYKYDNGKCVSKTRVDLVIECPAGSTKRLSGDCVEMHSPRYECPRGSTSNAQGLGGQSSECIIERVTEKTKACPIGSVQVDSSAAGSGAECILTISRQPTCPEGTALAGDSDRCAHYIPKRKQCPPATDPHGDVCARKEVGSPVPQCPRGMTLDGARCTMTTELLPVCPANTIDNGDGRCLHYEAKTLSCPPDFFPHNAGNCKGVTRQPLRGTCSNGAHPDDNCRVMVAVPLSPHCPKGRLYAGTTCTTVEKSRVKFRCPMGYNLSLVVPQMCEKIIRYECPIRREEMICSDASTSPSSSSSTVEAGQQSASPTAEAGGSTSSGREEGGFIDAGTIPLEDFNSAVPGAGDTAAFVSHMDLDFGNGETLSGMAMDYSYSDSDDNDIDPYGRTNGNVEEHITSPDVLTPDGSNFPSPQPDANVRASRSASTDISDEAFSSGGDDEYNDPASPPSEIESRPIARQLQIGVDERSSPFPFLTVPAPASAIPLSSLSSLVHSDRTYDRPTTHSDRTTGNKVNTAAGNSLQGAHLRSFPLSLQPVPMSTVSSPSQLYHYGAHKTLIPSQPSPPSPMRMQPSVPPTVPPTPSPTELPNPLPVCHTILVVEDKTCEKVIRAQAEPICPPGGWWDGARVCRVEKNEMPMMKCDAHFDSEGNCVVEENTTPLFDCPLGFVRKPPSTLSGLTPSINELEGEDDICEKVDIVRATETCPPDSHAPDCAAYTPKECPGGNCITTHVERASLKCPPGFNLKTAGATGGASSCYRLIYADRIAVCPADTEEVDALTCASYIPLTEETHSRTLPMQTRCPPGYSDAGGRCVSHEVLPGEVHCPTGGWAEFDDLGRATTCVKPVDGILKCPADTIQEVVLEEGGMMYPLIIEGAPAGGATQVSSVGKKTTRCWIYSTTEPVLVDTVFTSEGTTT